jgi:multiple sugar transport system ATP-binding protein
MAFGLKLRKMPKDDIRRRVEDAAKTLEITEYLDRKPKALSGGQRQRVAMGRAIVREPAAFLMDEPLSNLDAKLRVQMRSELGLLHARLQTTTLYVTHDQIEAMTMGDRVAVIRKGTLQQSDTPRVLYDEPMNLFVAGFIGSPSMNFIYGRLGQDGDKQYVEFARNRLTIDRSVTEARPGLAEHAGKELVIGVRPESFELADAAPGHNPEHTAEVEADLVEQLGSEAYIHFISPERPVVTPDIRELLEDEGVDEATLGNETKMVARVNPDFAPSTGAKARIVIDTTKLHFFDPESGLAIR